MSALLALAEKVEAAAGPSRELDEEIARALGWQPSDKLRGDSWWYHRGTDVWMNGLPHYTASIDAALTLVPDGSGNGSFFLQRNRFGSSHATVWYNTEFNFYRDGDGATPALALCAAALRARAAVQPPGG